MPNHNGGRLKRVILAGGASITINILLLGIATDAEAQTQPPEIGTATVDKATKAEALAPKKQKPPQIDQQLTGPRTRVSGTWVGHQSVPASTPILVMAGHADSQAMHGAGTPGAAVDLHGAAPMDPRMRDELYWNRLVRDAVVSNGQLRGLNIKAYDPGTLSITNSEDPRTNWSVARRQSTKGDYILEIHFDAYSPYGFGSGLIPAINRMPNRLDESLAISFGRFPRLFRGGLGGPRRGISILEIGMLEGKLETSLRDPKTREATIQSIAHRISQSLAMGMMMPSKASNQQPGEAGIAPRAMNPQTNSEVE